MGFICAIIHVSRDYMYTLGKNSMFVVANKSREAFAEKGGAGGRGVTGAWGVASRNRLGLVRSRRGFHREFRAVGPLAHSKTELRERTGHSRG